MQGNGFSLGGDGPSDVIAFPNVYELFGDKAPAAVQTIRSSLSTWATSQAESGTPVEALKIIFQIQADLIVKHNGEFRCYDHTLWHSQRQPFCVVSPRSRIFLRRRRS